MKQPEQLVTVREVAGILGMHEETVRKLCRTGVRSGGMRSIKGPGVNSKYRIPVSAVVEWQQRNAYIP